VRRNKAGTFTRAQKLIWYFAVTDISDEICLSMKHTVMFVCCQDEKRAALRDLESAQLKELAEKHGLSNDKALPENSTEVYELQWFCIRATHWCCI